jgi:two-component system, sensor histidine kinase
MDVRMPVMDGLETTRKMRQMQGTLATIPNIAVTAAASLNDVKKCRSAGFNEVLSKPFREMDLYRTESCSRS